MRTKTAVLAALMGLASAASVMAADAVYSLNTVGYVNLTFKPGWTLFVNPLNVVVNSATNRIADIIPNAPVDISLFIYEPSSSSYKNVTYYAGDTWDDPDQVLNLGVGAWINNSASTNIVLTFVGEVAQGKLTNSIPAGWSLQGSQVPQGGDLEATLGYAMPTEEGSDVGVFQFVNDGMGGGSYVTTFHYSDGWDGAAPTISVGEGFWVSSVKAHEWVRTFSVQ